MIMKVRLSYLLLFGIVPCFLLGGCASRIVNIPTHTYCYEKQDSFSIEKHSINLDSLNVLFISLVDDSTVTRLDSLYDILLDKRASGVCIKDIRSSSGMKTVSREGELRNQFLNLSYLKVVHGLQKITDVFVLNQKSAKITRNRMDSLIQKYDIDVVIAADMIIYDTKQEVVESSHPVDSYVISHARLSHSTSYNDRSDNICIQYKSAWRLLWLDKSTKKVQRKQEIVQTGQYWDTNNISKGITLMEGVFACALKVADDFVSIFK